MKSINQIALDNNVFRASNFLRDDDGAVPYDLVIAEYDFESAHFNAISFLEEVYAAFADKNAMAQLFHMNDIDDATFKSLKAALNAVTRGKARNAIAELDQTVLALSIYMRSHPAHEALYATQDRRAEFSTVFAEVIASDDNTFNCQTGWSEP